MTEDPRCTGPFSDARDCPVHRPEVSRHEWETWGIIELAIRNVNVDSYMRHWEGRALTAEAHLAVVLHELERFRGTLTSIANNSCCTPCREAALVARAALDA
jgi:hypothetical protein